MEIITIGNADINTKRRMIDEAAAGGRIFGAKFIKKDGTPRTMQCKQWVDRHLTYGKNDVRQNPCASKEHLYTVSDIGASDAFRNIDLNTLQELSYAGNVYVFGEKK